MTTSIELARSLSLLPGQGGARTEIADERRQSCGRHQQVVVRDSGARDRGAEAAGRGERQPRGLRRERGLVDRAFTEQRDIRSEQDDVERTARVAEMPMRDEFERVE